MAQYADKLDAEGFGAEFMALSARFRDGLMESASRSIDRLCDVSTDFFSKAGDTATARDFYGDGTAFLALDPYAAATAPTVVMESGYDEPTWIERGEEGRQFLVVNSQVKEQDVSQYAGADSRYVGWHDRVKVTVTAKWGFTAVPDEVRQATIEMALHTWRKADPARSSIEGGTPSILTRGIPPTVETTVNELKGRFSRKAAFA